MIKIHLSILLSAIFIFIPFISVQAESLGERLDGQILLEVERNGEAWYVHEEERRYMPDGASAYQLMRDLGLGITDKDLANIPDGGDTVTIKNKPDVCGTNVMANRLKGRILLQVQQLGEAWYIYPKNCQRIYMSDGEAAYEIMRFLSLGITTNDLSLIPIAGISPSPQETPIESESTNTAGSYEEQTIQVGGSSFDIQLVRINLQTLGLKIMTDSVSDTDCDTNCPVQSLQDYVIQRNGFAAIHGSYFCPSSYSGCAGSTNYFFHPVFDTNSGNFINEDQLKWPTTGPILVFDTENNVHFIVSTRDFKSPSEFESTVGVTIQAAIGNLPPLIYNGENIVDSQVLDNKQRTVKSSRGGIAIKGDDVYLIVAQSATVVDLANIMDALDVTHGMNLDGGGSTALYFEGEYKAGPGRDLPNAIVFGME